MAVSKIKAPYRIEDVTINASAVYDGKYYGEVAADYTGLIACYIIESSNNVWATIQWFNRTRLAVYSNNAITVKVRCVYLN